MIQKKHITAKNKQQTLDKYRSYANRQPFIRRLEINQLSRRLYLTHFVDEMPSKQMHAIAEHSNAPQIPQGVDRGSARFVWHISYSSATQQQGEYLHIFSFFVN